MDDEFLNTALKNKALDDENAIYAYLLSKSEEESFEVINSINTKIMNHITINNLVAANKDLIYNIVDFINSDDDLLDIFTSIDKYDFINKCEVIIFLSHSMDELRCEYHYSKRCINDQKYMFNIKHILTIDIFDEKSHFLN